MAQSAVPELVRGAQRLADDAGFAHSSSDGTGRLLRVLARRCERAGEIGTGCGVGSAWIASGLAPGGSLVTIERDAELVRRVRRLFSDVPAVRVRAGEWRELLDELPFDLLFADVADAREHAHEVVSAVAPGGLVVLCDLPVGATPDGDALRAHWLGHPELATAEASVSDAEAVIVAARLP